MWGTLVAKRTTRESGKSYYIFYVEVYKDKSCPPKFIRAIWGSFLEDYGINENIIGKMVDISLATNYLSNSTTEFNITLSDSKILLPVETENLDTDSYNPTEAELRMIQNVKQKYANT